MTEHEKFEKWYSDQEKYGDAHKSDLLKCWQAATKAAAPQWIPVSERLPDNGALVVGSDGATKCSSFATFEFFNGKFHLQTDGLDASNYDGGAVIECCFIVTNWMPLPAAPEVK